MPQLPLKNFEDHAFSSYRVKTFLFLNAFKTTVAKMYKTTVATVELPSKLSSLHAVSFENHMNLRVRIINL